MFEFLSQHGTDALAVLVALMSLLKIIVRLTPTLKDDAVFAKFDDFFNAIIPNYTKDANTPK
tara:strand:- start:10864 stop:11049 length:186 start_codon:yes stop_codon:yes gene_type:complete